MKQPCLQSIQYYPWAWVTSCWRTSKKDICFRISWKWKMNARARFRGQTKQASILRDMSLHRILSKMGTENTHGNQPVLLHCEKATVWSGLKTSFITRPYFFEQTGTSPPVPCTVSGKCYEQLRYYSSPTAKMCQWNNFYSRWRTTAHLQIHLSSCWWDISEILGLSSAISLQPSRPNHLISIRMSPSRGATWKICPVFRLHTWRFVFHNTFWT